MKIYLLVRSTRFAPLSALKQISHKTGTRFFRFCNPELPKQAGIHTEGLSALDLLKRLNYLNEYAKRKAARKPGGGGGVGGAGAVGFVVIMFRTCAIYVMLLCYCIYSPN